MRHMTVVSEQQLQRVTAGRQLKMRFGLAQTKVQVVLVVRNDLVERWQIDVDEQMVVAGIGFLNPAGATPAPLRPMRTQNLPPGITCPSAGQMIYTLAFSDIGLGSARAVTVVSAQMTASDMGSPIHLIFIPLGSWSIATL